MYVTIEWQLSDNWVRIECWKLGIKVAKIEHYLRLQFVLIVNNNNIYNMVSINMFYICFIYVLYNFTFVLLLLGSNK